MRGIYKVIIQCKYEWNRKTISVDFLTILGEGWENLNLFFFSESIEWILLIFLSHTTYEPPNIPYDFYQIPTANKKFEKKIVLGPLNVW